ncbi:hypothetical protein ASPWEDRAFT_169120 [Aspergillus wentii DTO 134E9]|uniref:Uncharacterized protein n=1 Tax=Aspergillus wentii DTO 134E9 TaxID=1073089 RepID=A0A1L9RWD8_ASPWE|nr:uncharacterized protein ASPWEDRAFT_169120 [Aspergillus wentii DTO 134E9]KAI9929044.1 hypothetical protein MW887_001439 [Aspergillus wentii]OJJ39261.1 hypothetical protein ASPWEDRAFT_169120 [Aspergillus wentii DTO 134E9]
MADGLNQARALRVAELINDYRTLLIHIPQQNVDASPDEYNEEGFVVMRKCLAESQALLSSNYHPTAVPPQFSNAEAEKAELKRVILDGSARRFQAHRIYLRAAAAKRWAIHRASLLRGSRPTADHAAQLKSISESFRREYAQVTDQHVVADLRAADLRAGHWLNDDPPLEVILHWIRANS